MELIRQHVSIFPGVCELIRLAATHYPLAIASGSLRPQIEHIIEKAGIGDAFAHISSAEDIRQGKPDPEIFLHALTGLNRGAALDEPIVPADCLVIEDSRPGVRAARAAGMKVLAVTNTHPADELQEADAIVGSLAGVNLVQLKRQLWAP
ncbi:MAG: HAD family hydrolase [Chloroflexota bacterium]